MYKNSINELPKGWKTNTFEKIAKKLVDLYDYISAVNLEKHKIKEVVA